MDDPARYVARLLARYRRLPGTVGHIRRQDRLTARALFDRRIRLDVVEQAFLLALARRSVRVNSAPLEPIRTLAYFLPVIDEVANEPLDPGYCQYLRARLDNAGLRPPD